jgi:hypothetical protein
VLAQQALTQAAADIVAPSDMTGRPHRRDPQRWNPRVCAHPYRGLQRQVRVGVLRAPSRTR